MATFTYGGPSEVLYLCFGRRTAALHRGKPTELDGAAAEHAARHPQVREVVGEDPDADLKVVEPTAAEVRAWARANDIEVPDRGALRPELYEQYKAAHAGG